MLFEVFEQLHTMLTSQKTARFNSELSILSDALGMWGWVFGVVVPPIVLRVRFVIAIIPRRLGQLDSFIVCFVPAYDSAACTPSQGVCSCRVVSCRTTDCPK